MKNKMKEGNMRIDIEETKQLNYKKVILVLAIIILVALCIYIGIILPKLANADKIPENKAEGDISEIGKQREEMNTIDVILNPNNKPERNEQEVKKEYPIITAEGIEKINNIYYSDYKRVFLTFDDGPSKTVTPEILRILDDYNVKATFFVLGSRVELYPEIVKEEYEKGHYIGNHGYSHKYSYIYSSIDNVLSEYRNAENIIRNALEMPEYCSNVFRFPGGMPRWKIC